MDPADLQRLLDEANRRIEEEKRGREEANRRVEEEKRGREEANRRVEEANRRAEEAEELSRKTTLDEYLSACHTSVFTKLVVQTDLSLTTKGSIATPRNKWCPTNLQPWLDFPDCRKAIFASVYSGFPAEMRLFESKAFLDTLGDRVSRRRIGDEKTLELFLHNSVEDPVRSIVEQVNKVPGFNHVNGIIFENHPHAISDAAQEVVHQETVSRPPQTPGQALDLNQLRPDQICIYKSDNAGLRAIIYICEYKPPHKLSASHLRYGLRPMDMCAEVVNRKTIPTDADPSGRFLYFADRLTACALTQTYHYMIEAGLEYSLLTTGEAIVFLKIDWEEDTRTLYYHLAEPTSDVMSADPADAYQLTAVGQYLAFTLMALGTSGESRQHAQGERSQAMERSEIWAEDFESALRSTSVMDRRMASNGSLFIPDSTTTYGSIDGTPIAQRLTRGARARGRCNDDDQPPLDEQSSSSSNDELSAKQPHTPSPTLRRSDRLVQRPRGGAGGGGKGAGPGGAGATERPYCTSKCLLGLAKGEDLDPACPNFELHREHCATGPKCHPVSHATWLEMLREQLQQSLDDGITRLPFGGARSVLFKVTLLRYGYTFVSKGTVKAFIPALEHEAAVYRRLLPIQGKHVPVFLGAIDLRQTNQVYYYDHRVYVVHLTFLSWAGRSIAEAEAHGESRESLRQGALQSARAVHAQRVFHSDMRAPNMLFNAEVNGVMVIDFERAEMLKLRRADLAPMISSNKRARHSERLLAESGQLPRKPYEDLLMVEHVFSM